MTEEQNQQIADLVKNLVERMGISCRVSIEENIKGNVFNIASPDSNLLIGQKGNNLQALQIIANNIAHKNFEVIERFSIDVDDYKKKREWQLREIAKRALEQVKNSRKSVTLEPMMPYERRVIHAFLSEEYDIETESIGAEPNRRIVLKPKARGTI